MDLQVNGSGTVYLLRSRSARGERWIEQNVADGPRLGNALAIEHRFVEAIIEGALADGLAVEFNGGTLRAGPA